MNKLKELETQFKAITPPSGDINQGLKFVVNQNGVLTISQSADSRTNNQLNLDPDQAQAVFNYLKNILLYE